MGYKIFQIIENQSENHMVASENENSIENEVLILTINDDELQVTNKMNGRTISKLLEFEEQADDGDSYDFSPLKNDIPLYNNSIQWLESHIGLTEQSMKVRATLTVPQDLIERKTQKLPEQRYLISHYA